MPMTGRRYGIDAPVKEGRVDGWDGTGIAFYVGGAGPRRLVMAPGLGTPFITWKYLIERFGDRYTIVTWDPRGTYGSDVPKDPDNMTLEDHVRDMVSVCEAVEFEGFDLGGWSMGVQICLEYQHRFPGRVKSLMLIAGTYQHVLSTAFGLPAAHEAFKAALRIGGALSAVIGPLASRALRSRAFVDVLGAAGMVTGNRPHFGRMARELSYVDWRAYLRLILLLDRHSAAAYLPEIEVPTLVIAGDRDRLTPMPVMERMHREIPGAEWFTVHRGTHYLLVEFPDLVNARMDRFLRSVS